MAFTYLSNYPLEEARELFLKALIDAGLKQQVESVPTSEANGRITAEAVYARICAPHYNACAMDGIALVASLTYSASETRPVTLPENSFKWVNTGDPLPENYDCVVMVEDVIETEQGVLLFGAAVPWQHVRQIGEDIAAGDMVVPSFTELSPSALGALLAAGVLEVPVIRKPIVGIIPTGNELVAPSANPRSGDIIEFNSTIFSGMMQDWGCETKVYPVASDKSEEIISSLKNAIAECDLVLLNAGSSAGQKDFSVEAIQSVGTVVLHGVAIKPGKPTILGLTTRGEQLIPLVGLPGYPVSGILVLEQLIKPVIALMTGRQVEKSGFVEATVSRRLVSSLKYLEFIRARLGKVGGRIVAVPLNRGAGVVSSFVKADGIIHVPQNVEGYEAGEKARVELLRPMSEIEQTLVITGSHDPLIDEVIDIMRRTWPDSFVASSHVGSMGGIMAVKRGEAHLGGVHLLDEASGEYNRAYVRKYIPEGKVKLVRCVQRSQGLMVAKGNPLGIRGIEDLPRLRYVNRQKGSGTRILLDYLLKQSCLNVESITGYEREEITHTAVAAAVASGTADAGMGILSAARIYDLDFIPICKEEYDLLILESALSMESVQRLISILQSNELAARLEKLGGYQIDQPGEIIQWN
ncbi:MAG TPA: molybdopterin biosynthesis protein [Anaerolineaceae bacterium]|mgnify:FL=1|nr:molybdopterin biosynthesis protein [Anaerolineaceae bacterium]